MKPDRTRSSSFQFRSEEKKNIKSETPIGIYPSISVNKEKQQKNKKKPATKCVWWWCGPWGSLVGAVGPVMTPVGHRNVVPLIFFPSFPSWKKKFKTFQLTNHPPSRPSYTAHLEGDCSPGSREI